MLTEPLPLEPAPAPQTTILAFVYRACAFFNRIFNLGKK